MKTKRKKRGKLNYGKHVECIFFFFSNETLINFGFSNDTKIGVCVCVGVCEVHLGMLSCFCLGTVLFLLRELTSSHHRG